MIRFVILLDGDMTPTARLKSQVEDCRVIAADGGVRHADPLSLLPEVWLGDFDSAPMAVPEQFTGIPRIPYPQDKDATDGEIAVNEALERGAGELLLVGAFGGRRADHALLHKTMALALAGRKIKTTLSDGVQEGYPLLAGKHQFEFEPDTLFSLIGFSDLADLTITGVKWPLENVDIALGSSLTLSNEVIGKLEISLGSGIALLVAQVAN
ncbi:MAG: thiamine diphosphokinase [Rhizobiaceae bacterium]